jgi:DNA (cytosine-5)-methyltransferase 1
MTSTRTVLEICAGAGGQSLGLERAGFRHVGAVEIDRDACATLRANRPEWDVIEADVRTVSGGSFAGVDLLAGGVPCPPFSIAGRQLGADDERDLFPEALRLAAEAQPRAIMLENVRGFAASRFDEYRARLKASLLDLGYASDWRILNARDFGVPQLRPRFVLVAMAPGDFEAFRWPIGAALPHTVGEALADLVGADGWPGVFEWRGRASEIAPTIVGGSHKHGGADLGPTRAKRAWRELGVDAMGVGDRAPAASDGAGLLPRLTLRMVARLQGFPDSWRFEGRKTSAYRQIGNAFPPPVAEAVGRAIATAIGSATSAGRASARELAPAV